MKYYVGIDVSKKILDIDGLENIQQITNEPEAIKQFISQINKIFSDRESSVLIICEASGGYEQKLVDACRLAEISIHVAHANKVRAFAKSQGLLAKTDKLDAKVISLYGRLLQVNPDVFLLNENTENIKSLLKRRKQLVNEKLREKNRLEILKDMASKESIFRHIDWIKEEIKLLEQELKSLQKAADVQSSIELLTSIPGIGVLAASYLIAFLPELGKLPPKAIAALVGLAPFNRDSGTFKGKRFIQGGRAQLRHILYISAVASTRWNSDLQTFYKRLRDVGKPAKVAMVAVARKLLMMANSVMSRQTQWQKIAPSII
jgi:transposase